MSRNTTSPTFLRLYQAAVENEERERLASYSLNLSPKETQTRQSSPPAETPLLTPRLETTKTSLEDWTEQQYRRPLFQATQTTEDLEDPEDIYYSLVSTSLMSKLTRRVDIDDDMISIEEETSSDLKMKGDTETTKVTPKELTYPNFGSEKKNGKAGDESLTSPLTNTNEGNKDEDGRGANRVDTTVTGSRDLWASINELRQFIGSLVNNEYVQFTMIVFIFINAIMMGIATYPYVAENTKRREAFDVTDDIFLYIFTAELAMQFIYLGFGLLKDGWLVFDLIIISTTVFFRHVQIIRAFRAFRALRLITRVRLMRDLLTALFSVFPRMVAIFLMLLLIFYVFAVMSTQLYGNLCYDLKAFDFYKDYDGYNEQYENHQAYKQFTKLYDEPCYKHEQFDYITNSTSCAGDLSDELYEDYMNEMKNDFYASYNIFYNGTKFENHSDFSVCMTPLSFNYFGSLEYSFLTLFQIMTMDGWADIVWEIAPANISIYYYVVAFVIMSGFIVVNLIVAVICDAISALDQAEKAKVYGYDDSTQDPEEDDVYDEYETEAKELREQLDFIEDRIGDLTRIQARTFHTLQYLSQQLHVQKEKTKEDFAKNAALKSASNGVEGPQNNQNKRSSLLKKEASRRSTAGSISTVEKRNNTEKRVTYTDTWTQEGEDKSLRKAMVFKFANSVRQLQMMRELEEDEESDGDDHAKED